MTAPALSGGKEVCRRGWAEDAEVVESIEALRRLGVGAAGGMSDCLRFGGSCALVGYGGESWEKRLWAQGGGSVILAVLKGMYR
jgi:hypothetical protein